MCLEMLWEESLLQNLDLEMGWRIIGIKTQLETLKCF